LFCHFFASNIYIHFDFAHIRYVSRGFSFEPAVSITAVSKDRETLSYTWTGTLLRTVHNRTFGRKKHEVKDYVLQQKFVNDNITMCVICKAMQVNAIFNNQVNNTIWTWLKLIYFFLLYVCFFLWKKLSRIYSNTFFNNLFEICCSSLLILGVIYVQDGCSV